MSPDTPAMPRYAPGCVRDALVCILASRLLLPLLPDPIRELLPLFLHRRPQLVHTPSNPDHSRSVPLNHEKGILRTRISTNPTLLPSSKPPNIPPLSPLPFSFASLSISPAQIRQLIGFRPSAPSTKAMQIRITEAMVSREMSGGSVVDDFRDCEVLDVKFEDEEGVG